MDMPFGKHKGTPLEDLPRDYLDWLNALEDLRPPLRSAVDREIERRAENDKQKSIPRSRTMTPDLVPFAEEIVKAGLHTLALREHPDRGGNLRRMQDINAAADAMRKFLGK